jgi:hypothetical protein
MNNPQNRSEAHSILMELWAGRPEAEAGRVIVDFLAQHTDAVHISFAQLFEVARQAQVPDRSAVLNIINYLTGADLNLLKTAFEYIEDDNAQPLDVEQVRAAQYRRINPLTGDEDANIGSKIFMFFLPSELAKKALAVRDE